MTASIVERLRDLGLAVHANDAAGVAEVKRADDAGADRLSTYDVELAVSTVLARNG